MQQWSSRHGVCASCLFRNISRTALRPPQHGHHLSQNAHAISTSAPCLRSDRLSPSIRKTNARPNAASKKETRNDRPQRTTDALLTDDHIAVKAFPHRVETQLEVLKTRLNSTSTVDDPNLTQLHALDPEGKSWQPFADSVHAILNPKKKGEWSLAQQSLHRALVKANSGAEYRSDMTKTLHFAFIDSCLKPQDKSKSALVPQIPDLRYPTEWYTRARTIQRDIHLHVGPTNSGKTYNALKKLESARDGFYAGPLRLLAHEVYSRFNAKGIPCDLVTGDDVRLVPDSEANITASTVEMVDCSRLVDVAVIDEIQMMASEDRGWAWTRAFLGASAKEVHLCGETRVVPLVRELAASMGDTLHIHQYERLSPLKAMSRSLRGNLKNLRKGDCIVSFSIVGIHALKKQIEVDTGRRVAIVYGSLPPEVRAQQAGFFNDPDNDYDFLVASDAIGMGLNLNIKRIIFETTRKFNGMHTETLSIPQIKQIAGRAGRYRSAYQDTRPQTMSLPSAERQATTDRPVTVGLVTCLEDIDLQIIQEALNAEAPPLRAAGILPPAELIDDYVAHLPKGLPFEYVFQRLCDEASMHPRFVLCNIREQLKIANIIESIHGLTVGQRFLVCASPAIFRTPGGQMVVRAMARCIASNRAVTVADLLEIPLEVLDQEPSSDRWYLDQLEFLHKSLILYLWLSYRFLNIFKDQEMANHAKELCEKKINQYLLEFSANPKLRRRLLKMRQAAPILPGVEGNEGQVDRVPEEIFEGVDDQPDVLSVDWSKGSMSRLTPPDNSHEAMAQAGG